MQELGPHAVRDGGHDQVGVGHADGSGVRLGLEVGAHVDWERASAIRDVHEGKRQGAVQNGTGREGRLNGWPWTVESFTSSPPQISRARMRVA